MSRLTRLAWVFLAVLVLVPTAAFGQASITGVVRDESGAVLPGVTVEAASPVLIEKLRSVVTDGSGQYRIVDLRPGTYAVAFTLAGFNVVRREGIELTGTFAATVNADLVVGSINETVTVSGDSPIVDVQNAQQQRVLEKDVIDALPTGRGQASLAVLIPGVSAVVPGKGAANPMDVGGVGILQNIYLTMYGSSYLDQRVSIDGAQVRNIIGPGNANNFVPDMGSMQEVVMDFGGGSAEQVTGGVRINFIPREGGNSFRASAFGTGANPSFQTNNYTQELKDRGLAAPNRLSHLYDVNTSVGGPVIRDRVWFFTSARWQENENFVGTSLNLNADNPEIWTYAPDPNNQGRYGTLDHSVNTRVTWQVTPKNKLNLYWHQAKHTWVDARVLVSPEAFGYTRFPQKRFAIASWTAPMTDRLLIDARVSTHGEAQDNSRPNQQIVVIEQGGPIPGLTYHGANFSRTDQPNIFEVQSSATYVTGSHAFKVGFTNTRGESRSSPIDRHMVGYRFNNGIPNQLTQRAPAPRANRMNELGAYVQDRWTVKQMTVTAGLRFDYFGTGFPEQYVGPAAFAPNRNITFPATDWYSLKDLSPRLGVAYDLFGDGKTALKVSLSRYAAGAGASNGEGNPVGTITSSVTRPWNDANRDYVPDCDLTILQPNGECGIVSDLAFGTPRPTTSYDPKTLSGWNTRLTNSAFTVAIQHELMPRVGLMASYGRRWYGNFNVTDNRATTAADYTPFTITAPVDPRLPGGGGYVVGNIANLNPNRVGQVDNYVTRASNYGKMVHNWQGIDAGINVRVQQGLMLQGGVSSGRTLTDKCDVLEELPELQVGYESFSLTRDLINVGVTNNGFCRNQTKFLTQLKLLGTYEIPKIGMQFAATYQDVAGPEVLATYTASNAVVQPSLGRPLSGGAANVTVPLIAPGDVYGPRARMLDLRLSKPFRYGRTRTNINLDVYNSLNANTVTFFNQNYGATGVGWLSPTTIIDGRLVKISAQFEF